MTLEKQKDIIEGVLSPVDSVTYAFLFGSALTKLRKDSDVDILVGGDLDFDTRMDLTARLALALKRTVDLVPAQQTRPEVVLKALSKGLRLFVRDSEALKHDYLKAFRAYDDTISLRRIKAAHLKRRFADG